MSRAADAYERLHYAMQNTDPECRGDDRFILDDQPAETLAYICQRCPLFDLCTEYARIARPTGGSWAGKKYHAGSKKKETA